MFGHTLIQNRGSFSIHQVRQFGPWSLIHLLSIYMLAVLPLAVLQARRHRIKAHRQSMIGLFIGALVLAGLLTLLPGRVMNEVVFGS
jgi:uncharacterized membrane protein